IDWGVYARSDRLVVKTFREEQDLSVLVLLDTSASMSVPASDRKWERSCEIALALAYIALMEQDSVCVSAPGMFDSPFYYGARAIHDLTKSLLSAERNPSVDFLREAQRAVAKVRFPGVAVLVSDFLMPLSDIQALVNVMRAKNLDITAIQVLGPGDTDPLRAAADVIAVDSETGEEMEIGLDSRQREQYAALLEDHNRSIQDIFGSARIRYTRADTTTSLADFLIRNLAVSGLLK
ncbi:MAG: DUF58 domain-containing protein, partial [Deltaproteobacteria bacterium]|nr:DUF58 domain-containing protein [Deltaproteobacteria bacterium]